MYGCYGMSCFVMAVYLIRLMSDVALQAEEEYNVEKSRLIHDQRNKIIEYYNRKREQNELQRKM